MFGVVVQTHASTPVMPLVNPAALYILRQA